MYIVHTQKKTQYHLRIWNISIKSMQEYHVHIIRQQAIILILVSGRSFSLLYEQMKMPYKLTTGLNSIIFVKNRKWLDLYVIETGHTRIEISLRQNNLTCKLYIIVKTDCG